jgi:CHASE2 domain-containing sensor protein
VAALAAAVVAAVFVLFVRAPDFLTTMETKLYDLHFALRGARDPGDQVVIVAADEKSLAALGRDTEAHEVAHLLMQLEPRFSARRFATGYAFRDEARRRLFGEHLIKAGLPE